MGEEVGCGVAVGANERLLVIGLKLCSTDGLPVGDTLGWKVGWELGSDDDGPLVETELGMIDGLLDGETLG